MRSKSCSPRHPNIFGLETWISQKFICNSKLIACKLSDSEKGTVNRDSVKSSFRSILCKKKHSVNAYSHFLRAHCKSGALISVVGGKVGL